MTGVAPFVDDAELITLSISWSSFVVAAGGSGFSGWTLFASGSAVFGLVLLFELSASLGGVSNVGSLAIS